MANKNVKLESIYNLKYVKPKLLRDYFNKLPSGILPRKVDLMRKRLKVKSS